MSKLVIRLIILIVLVGNVAIFANEKSIGGSNQDLVGRWVSKSIDGDALFFIISEIEGRIMADNKFYGKVSFTDYQTASKSGHYKVDDDYVYFYIGQQKKPYKLRYWFNDKSRQSITVKDEKFGVTLKLKKAAGKPTKNSGSFLQDL